MLVNVPSTNVPFVGPNDTITTPWFRLLTDLSQSVNANTNNSEDQLAFGFIADEASDLPSDQLDFSSLLWADEPSEQFNLPQAFVTVTVGASPYSYSVVLPGVVIVEGGTVSAIDWARQGVTLSTGLTAGLFNLEYGDVLTITYTVAPNVTFAGRAF